MNLGPESEHVEHKKSTGELREGIESIASILNKHGRGTLFFGVRNDGEVIGQELGSDTLRKVSQAIGNAIVPAVYPEIKGLSDEAGHTFIRVDFAGNDAPYACGGRYRIRMADEDVLMSDDELRRQVLRSQARKVPWEQWESDRPISDVDEDELRSFVERGNACGRISYPFTTTEDVLCRLGLLRGGRLTNAGEVLFCPSRTPGLKMGILATHARTEILDLHQEEGTLFDLVRKAERYILVNTRRRFVIEGLGPREEIPELPQAAVREVLFNAYAHRDWTSSACVQIDIFNDAVEITNPGWFIEGQWPDRHLTGEDSSSLSRNMLIVSTLYKSKDIEAYGTGIPRIRSACEAAGIAYRYKRVPIGTKFIFCRRDAFEEAEQPLAMEGDRLAIAEDGPSQAPGNAEGVRESAGKCGKVRESAGKCGKAEQPEREHERRQPASAQRGKGPGDTSKLRRRWDRRNDGAALFERKRRSNAPQPPHRQGARRAHWRLPGHALPAGHAPRLGRSAHPAPPNGPASP